MVKGPEPGRPVDLLEIRSKRPRESEPQDDWPRGLRAFLCRWDGVALVGPCTDLVMIGGGAGIGRAVALVLGLRRRVRAGERLDELGFFILEYLLMPRSRAI